MQIQSSVQPGVRIYQLCTQVSMLEKWPSLLLHKGFAHGSVSLKSVFGLCFEDSSGIWMVVSVLKALCVGQMLHRMCVHRWANLAAPE